MKSEIVVDVSEELLRAVDDWANYLSVSREELVVDALESYLRRKSEAKVIAETREIYATIAPEDRATAEAYIPLIDESLPAFWASAAMQDRVEYLLGKQRDIGLTKEEEQELDLYEEVDDYFSFANRTVRDRLG